MILDVLVFMVDVNAFYKLLIILGSFSTIPRVPYSSKSWWEKNLANSDFKVFARKALASVQYLYYGRMKTLANHLLLIH